MNEVRIIQMALKLFAKRLKLARKERGFSQGDLAKKTGLSLNDISRYERGTVSPSLENFVKIVEALEVASDALLFQESKAQSGEDKPRNLKLWERFVEVEAFDKADQDAVLRLIDAMVAKAKIRKVVGD